MRGLAEQRLDHDGGGGDEDDHRGGKGNLAVAPSSALAAGAPVPAEGSELERLVGKQVSDGHGYTFELDGDRALRVVGSPEGKSDGKRLRAGDANPKIAGAYASLLIKLKREHPPSASASKKAEIHEQAKPPQVPEKHVEPGLVASALDFVRDVGHGAMDFISGLLGGKTDTIGGPLAGPAPAPAVAPHVDAPAPAPAPAPTATGSATAAPAPSVDGKLDNLDVAQQLTKDIAVPHGDEKSQFDAARFAGDPENMTRAKQLGAGKIDELKSLKCNEFVVLTLAKSGWNVWEEYRDPKDHKLVAYLEGGKAKFVTLYALISVFPSDTAAILAAQRGECTTVEAGSDEAKRYGAGKRKEDFLLADVAGFGAGVDIDEKVEFGAGAAAISLGGKSIDPEDRKPGDLQQQLTTIDGKTKNGKGHSSQVFTVRGAGVAHVGAHNAPVLHGTPATPLAELEPGWYEVDGHELSWEVGATTDPSTVARLTAGEIKTIDANIGRGEHSAGTGPMLTQEAHSTEGKSIAYSDGRLPTSKWFAWEPKAVEATKLSAAAPKVAVKK